MQADPQRSRLRGNPITSRHFSNDSGALGAEMEAFLQHSDSARRITLRQNVDVNARARHLSAQAGQKKNSGKRGRYT